MLACSIPLATISGTFGKSKDSEFFLQVVRNQKKAAKIQISQTLIVFCIVCVCVSPNIRIYGMYIYIYICICIYIYIYMLYVYIHAVRHTSQKKKRLWRISGLPLSSHWNRYPYKQCEDTSKYHGILTALETSSLFFDPLKMRQGSIRSDFPSLLAFHHRQMSKESGPKVPIEAPKVETAAVFGWCLFGEDKVIPLSNYMHIYIYKNICTVVEKYMAQLVYRDPLPNLPFGICAIYFDLKVYPMTFLQLATILIFAKAFNFFKIFPIPPCNDFLKEALPPSLSQVPSPYFPCFP